MNVLSYVFLTLFSISSAIEIIFAFLEKEKARKIVKPLCLFFLAIFAMVTNFASPLIYLGALFGMLGDVFMFRKKVRFYFVLGTIAFLAGHICYISEILFVILKGAQLDMVFFVISIVSIIGVSLFLTPISYKVCKNKQLALLGSFYLTILMSVTGFAIFAACQGSSSYMLLTIVGGMVFLSSDLVLIFATFIKDFKRRDFYVMSLYLSGQALIVLGLVLTSLSIGVTL
ncbi:MAG: lysoplasmalogenase family protein [Bacilli bacterium]|jgi:uncharacterized membrane protein YhhN